MLDRVKLLNRWQVLCVFKNNNSLMVAYLGQLNRKCIVSSTSLSAHFMEILEVLDTLKYRSDSILNLCTYTRNFVNVFLYTKLFIVVREFSNPKYRLILQYVIWSLAMEEKIPLFLHQLSKRWTCNLLYKYFNSISILPYQYGVFWKLNLSALYATYNSFT